LSQAIVISVHKSLWLANVTEMDLCENDGSRCNTSFIVINMHPTHF